jgi:hypothetical protein
MMEHVTQFPEEYSKVAGVQKKVGRQPASPGQPAQASRAEQHTQLARPDAALERSPAACAAAGQLRGRHLSARALLPPPAAGGRGEEHHG